MCYGCFSPALMCVLYCWCIELRTPATQGISTAVSTYYIYTGPNKSACFWSMVVDSSGALDMYYIVHKCIVGYLYTVYYRLPAWWWSLQGSLGSLTTVILHTHTAHYSLYLYSLIFSGLPEFLVTNVRVGD